MIRILQASLKEGKKTFFLSLVTGLFFLLFVMLLLMGSSSIDSQIREELQERKTYREKMVFYSCYLQDFQGLDQDFVQSIQNLYDQRILTCYPSKSLSMRYDQDVFLLIGDLTLLKLPEEIQKELGQLEGKGLAFVTRDNPMKESQVQADSATGALPLLRADLRTLDRYLDKVGYGDHLTDRDDRERPRLYLWLRHFPSSWLEVFDENAHLLFADNAIVSAKDLEMRSLVEETYRGSDFKVVEHALKNREIQFFVRFFYPILLFALVLLFWMATMILNIYFQENAKVGLIHYLSGASLGEMLWRSGIHLFLVFLPSLLLCLYAQRYALPRWSYLSCYLLEGFVFLAYQVYFAYRLRYSFSKH